MNRTAVSFICVLLAAAAPACKKEAKDTEPTPEKSEKAEKASKADKADDDDNADKKKKKKTDDDEPKADDDKAEGKPCTLISTKDLEKILGHTVKFGANGNGDCAFGPVDESKMDGYHGSIAVHDYNAVAWEMLNKKAETIDDLGDKAAWGMGLLVKKGTKNLQVVLMGLGKKDAETKKAAVEIAKKALPGVKG